MSLLISAQSVPLRTDDGGVMRIGDTRVSLDSVVHAYRGGATAEQIAEDFPSLELADIHLVISYFLRHPVEVDQYLATQCQQADELQRRVTADTTTQVVRQRLLERRIQGAGGDAASDH